MRLRPSFLALAVSLSAAAAGTAAAQTAAPATAPAPATKRAPATAATPASKPAAAKPSAAKPAAAAPATAKPATAAAASARKEPIDINTASKADLQAVPGIGEAYSAKIIAGRPYHAKDDLTRRNILPAGVYAKAKEHLIARQH